MDTTGRVLWLRRLGLILVVMTFSLMVLGSWVKATGSGLSCPDWPQCYGEWLPPFPSAETGGTDPDAVDHADAYTQAQVLYEWTHRLVASLLGIPMLAFAWLAYRGRDLHPGLRWTPVNLIVVLLLQAGLGGITVIGRNAAALTTMHLATATLFFGLVVTSTMFAFLKPLPHGNITSAPVEATVVYPGEASLE